MKINNVVLIFALFICAHATGTHYQFASLAEISKISQTDFGKNLLDTVNIALEGQGNIHTVQDMLSALLAQLIKDQKAADVAWEAENKRLLARIEQLTKEIKVLDKEIRDLEDERTKLKKLIQQAQINLKQYAAQLEHNRSQIAHLKKTRADDHADFIRSQNQHEDIINAINVVVAELKKLKGSISGRGRPAHVQEIDQEVRDRKYEAEHKAGEHSFLEISEETKRKLEKSFLEITGDEQEANIFVEMATQADQAALNKLIDLLLKLRNSAVKSFNDDREKEAKSKKLYLELLDRLNNDNQKLNKMIVQQNKNLGEYKARLAKVENLITIKTSIRETKIKERTATEKERELKHQQYLREKEQRAEEMSVVRRLLDIVEKRLANMSAYLKGQVDN